MRVHARVAVVVASRRVVRAPGTACGAELPRGPVTAQTVASAQAESAARADRLDRRRARGRRGRRRARRRQGRRAGRCRRQGRATNPTRRTSPPPRPPRPRRPPRSRTSTRRPRPPPRPPPTRPPPPTNAAREAGVVREAQQGHEHRAARSLPDDTALPAVAQSDNVEYVGPRRGGSRAAPRQRLLPGVQPEQVPGVLGAELPPLREPRLRRHGRQRHAGLGVWSLKDPAHPKYISPGPAAQIGAVKTGETLTAVLGGREHDRRQPAQDRVHVARTRAARASSSSTSRTRGTRWSSASSRRCSATRRPA